MMSPPGTAWGLGPASGSVPVDHVARAWNGAIQGIDGKGVPPESISPASGSFSASGSYCLPQAGLFPRMRGKDLTKVVPIFPFLMEPSRRKAREAQSCQPRTNTRAT